MDAISSQITSIIIVYSTVYSDTDQRKHQSFASLAFLRGIHRGPVNSPHKWPVTRKVFPFDDVIVEYTEICSARLPGCSAHGTAQSLKTSVICWWYTGYMGIFIATRANIATFISCSGNRRVFMCSLLKLRCLYPMIHILQSDISY